MSTGELDVGLVLGSRMEPMYHVREVRSLLDAGYEVPLVLVDGTSPPGRPEPPPSLPRQLASFVAQLARGEFGVLLDAEQRLAETVHPSATVTEALEEASRKVDLLETVDALDPARTVAFAPESLEGPRYGLPDDVLEQAQEACDVLVLLSFNRILAGPSLDATRHGVLGFHGADIREYRGRPKALFEWIHDEPRIGLTLQQLTEDLDGGRIVLCEHADITDARSVQEVRLRSVELFGDVLARGLARLEDPDFTPETPALGELAHSSQRDEISNVLACLSKTLKRRYLA